MPTIREVNPEAFEYEARIARLESDLSICRGKARAVAKDIRDVLSWEHKRIGAVSYGALREAANALDDAARS